MNNITFQNMWLIIIFNYDSKDFYFFRKNIKVALKVIINFKMKQETLPVFVICLVLISNFAESLKISERSTSHSMTEVSHKNEIQIHKKVASTRSNQMRKSWP